MEHARHHLNGELLSDDVSSHKRAELKPSRADDRGHCNSKEGSDGSLDLHGSRSSDRDPLVLLELLIVVVVESVGSLHVSGEPIRSDQVVMKAAN